MLKSDIPFFLRLLLVFWTLLSGQLYARSSDTILILNSNREVAKYADAESGFRSVIKKRLITFDLRGRWIDETIIEETILDERPKVIYCIGLRAYNLAYKLAGKENNIIFSSIVNWQRLPMREQICGVANEIAPGMQMVNFSYLFPEIKRMGILYSKSHNREWLDQAIRSAKDMNLKIMSKEVSLFSKVSSTLTKLLSEIDALWLIPDPIVISSKKSVIEIFTKCEAAKIPVFAYDPAYLDYGAVMVISPDIETAGRQAGLLAKDLLSDKETPHKISNVAGSEIILNRKPLERLGLKFNPEALDSINQFID